MASVEEVCDHIALINKSQKILDGQVAEIKQQFKLNQFECTYQGSFSDVKGLMDSKFRLLEHIENSKEHYLKAELSNDFSNNDFLSLLMQKVKIISFNEVIPSMDDIFIRVVQNDSN